VGPSRSARAPERITWAVDLLDIGPEDRVLEIGCGTGVAVALVADRLDGGCITALDRSQVAIQRAQARNAGARHRRSGPAAPVRARAFDGGAASVDKAFAINVNVFWTSGAEPECAVLRRVLRPGGPVRLVYEGPGADGGRDVAPAVVASLEEGGLTTEVTRSPSGLVCVTGADRTARRSRSERGAAVVWPDRRPDGAPRLTWPVGEVTPGRRRSCSSWRPPSTPCTLA
jgi:SAM-dependent methyltransferase